MSDTFIHSRVSACKKTSRRPRVMIVNAYFDPWHSSTPFRLFVPRAMAPYHLAGFFDPERVDVRVYDEAYHGALLDRRRFQWPDLVVISGLTAMFDRARQLAAYFRHWRPGVRIAIGGPIPRALSGLSAQVFDMVLQGGVEDVVSVIDDTLGAEFRAETPMPRFDLTGHSLGLGFLETSTYCNFRCSFCSLTGEGRSFRPHSEDWIRRQLDAVGRRKALMVLDNNFYGNHLENFKARTEQIGAYWQRGAFRGWGALVTGDFFKKEKNLELVAQNGCLSLLSGVESLEPDVLHHFNKRHSISSDPRSLALLSAKYGVAFEYAMMVDFTRQRMAEIEDQLDYLLSDPDIPLPALLTLSIPILGTPYFDQAAGEGRLIPNLRLSDMDGQKLVERPLEPVEEVAAFIGDMLNLRGRKTALLRHTAGHAWRRRRTFLLEHLLINFIRPLHQYNGRIRAGSLRQMVSDLREQRRTYSGMTNPLRQAYRPRWHLPQRFAADFEPLMVTDEQGRLTDTINAERRIGSGLDCLKDAC